MKEQINKLALQAREHADSLLGKKLPDMVWQDEYNQKLVELIVRECIFVMNSTVDESIDFDRKLDETSCWIESDIKKHFGVE
jgi:hypothetical protein